MYLIQKPIMHNKDKQKQKTVSSLEDCQKPHVNIETMYTQTV